MEGGRVVQVGTPEEILQNPVDDYVRAFFRGVDPTNILSAEDVATDTQVTIRVTEGKNPRAALQRLIKHDREYGYVIDNDDKFLGIVSTESLRELLGDAEWRGLDQGCLYPGCRDRQCRRLDAGHSATRGRLQLAAADSR